MSLELADIFRRYEVPCWTSEQARAVADIRDCRTEAMGGYHEQCNKCGHSEVRYCSCGNRHCPKCQNLERAAWVERRRQELLPVPYFHVVFTLPHQLELLARRNPRLLYNLLFRISAETLLEIAADPKHLGARIGVLSVLHTWGQTLSHHPHVHCLVPAGGLSLDGTGWVSAKPNFFLPVRVLSARFRNRFLKALEKAYEAGNLALPGALATLVDGPAFANFINKLRRKDWVVYAQPPFAGNETVLKYQARYINRTAVTNNRLVNCDSSQLTISWKNYRDNGHRQLMVLSAYDFIQRFLVHILPGRFPRVRFYGQLANRNKGAFINKGRMLLKCRQALSSLPTDSKGWFEHLFGRPLDQCRKCTSGRLTVLEELPGRRIPSPARWRESLRIRSFGVRAPPAEAPK